MVTMTRPRVRAGDRPFRGLLDGAQRRRNVGATERAVSVLGGGAMALYGLSQRTGTGLLLAGIGAALAYRGATGHCDVYEALGISTVRRKTSTAIPSGQGVKLEESVTILRSPEELFSFWRRLENLPRVMENPKDLEARGNMMMASMMGAIAFQKGLGAAHSLAHPLSTEFGMHHGTANAVVLPAVLEYNRTVVADRLAELARQFDRSDAVECVRELNRIAGIPSQLRDCGIPESALPMLAGKAVEDGCHQLNPRACTRDDLLDLYRRAY